MNRKLTLSQSVNLMKNGSGRGFNAFFRASVQYAYRLAFYLFGEEEKALLFLEDFYPYLYLHIENYKGRGDEKAWINRQMLERYRQLSIGRNLPAVDFAGGDIPSVTLEQKKAERLYDKIASDIHFPPEASGRSLLSVVLLLLLVAGILTLVILLVGRRRALSQTDASLLKGASDTLDTDEENASGDDTDSDEDGAEVYQVTHDAATDGETTTVISEEAETPNVWTPTTQAPQTPSVSTPSATAPSVQDPTVTEPQITEPTLNAPSVTAGNSAGDGSTGNAQSAIDDFLEEIEEFEKYDVTDPD